MSTVIKQTDIRVVYLAAPGGEVAFPVPFAYPEPRDLNVFVAGVLTPAWSLTNGYVVLPAPVAGVTVEIVLAPDVERRTLFPVSGWVNMGLLNHEIDVIYAVLRAQDADLAALRVPTNGMVIVGEWSAASGAFPVARPDGSVIRAGDAWIVSAGGTVDSVVFTALDRVVALGAGGATYAGNWVKVAYPGLFDDLGAATVTPTGADPDTLANLLALTQLQDGITPSFWGGGGDYFRFGSNADNAGMSAHGLCIGGANPAHGTHGMFAGVDGHSSWLRWQPTRNYSPSEMMIFPTAAQCRVNTTGGTGNITRVNGSPFDVAWIGRKAYLNNGGLYRIASVAGSDLMTVTLPDGAPAALPALSGVNLMVYYIEATGVCSVSGSTVSRISGDPFPVFTWNTDYELQIDGVTRGVAAITRDMIVLTAEAGNIASASYRIRCVIDDTSVALRIQHRIGSEEMNLTLGARHDRYFLRTQATNPSEHMPLVLSAGQDQDQIALHVNGSLRFGHAPSAATPKVNYLEFVGAPAGFSPSFRLRGADADIGLTIDVKGAGGLDVTHNTFGTRLFYVNSSGVQMPSIMPKNFANDAAAAAGGLPIGGIYHTGGAMKVRLT